MTKSSLFISMLAWYGSQSEAAVSRCLWLGIIFRQPFPQCVLWDLVLSRCMLHLSTARSLLVSCFKFHIIKMWNSNHPAPWSVYTRSWPPPRSHVRLTSWELLLDQQRVFNKHHSAFGKVFRPHYFFHILLRYSLVLKLIQLLFSSICTQYPMMTKQKQALHFCKRI